MYDYVQMYVCVQMCVCVQMRAPCIVSWPASTHGIEPQAMDQMVDRRTKCRQSPWLPPGACAAQSPAVRRKLHTWMKSELHLETCTSVGDVKQGKKNCIWKPVPVLVTSNKVKRTHHH
jgi:hypothetical protein